MTNDYYGKEKPDKSHFGYYNKSINVVMPIDLSLSFYYQLNYEAINITIKSNINEIDLSYKIAMQKKFLIFN